VTIPRIDVIIEFGLLATVSVLSIVFAVLVTVMM
jgi:hypothetical protein